ncbi:unnamed protein product [Cuscuta epithymum]|uniref:F-box protein n=1 Tax=Cuscuta epithymum TaxID=186058 RepID=A0AAV0ESA1_9ASTE|nr:unnamed protein product [Cuscuta epithymum]
MSESIAQSYQECDERTGQSMYPIQSVWVTRWVGTSQNATPQASNIPNYALESNKKRDEVELGSAGDVRKFGTQAHEVVNESLRSVSGNIRVETSTHTSTTMSIPCRNGLSLQGHQETQGCLTAKPLHDLNPTSASGVSSAKNSCGPAANPTRQVKPHSFFRHSHTVASGPSAGNCMESASHIVPYRFGYGKFKDDASLSEMPLLMDSRPSKPNIPRSNSIKILEDKHSNYDSQLESESQPLKVNEDWFKKLQNGSPLAALKNNCTPLEESEPNKALNNNCIPEKLTHSLHDVKTMRICTTVDSVVGLTGCYPRFSQTTHSLLVMKESDVNACKENQTISTSRTFNEFNKKIFNDVLCHKQQGVKLQLLESSNASELEEEGVQPLEVDANNESSADTDAMDFDAFPGKSKLLGINFASLLKKECEKYQNLCRLTLMDQVGSDGIKKSRLLPKNNKNSSQPPDIHQSEATSADHLDVSSNTQSLDMESLVIGFNDQHGNSKPDVFHQSNLPGQDSSSRFAKRVKLSNLYAFGLGTRSTNAKEDLPHEKQHNRFRGQTCSEPMASKNKGKEWIVQDKCTSRKGGGDSSSSANMRGKLTSYPWIQRLLRDKGTTNGVIPDVVVEGYEAGSSELKVEEIQKRHFPSIAAMALMAKGMKGLHPCQFQKKGSFVVWNNSGGL